MTPIRFRAWHEGKMYYDVNVDHGGKPNIDADASTDDFRTYLRDGIVMQSTGLADKNGKEIFEGDIAEIILSDSPSHFEVIYDVESASFRWFRNKDGEHHLSIDPEVWKPCIIGHIYENPELLK